MVNIGVRSGVDYQFNSPIRNIRLSPDGKRAIGVEFSDPSKAPLDADLVICNADLTYAYNNLLPTTSYGTSLSKRETSCSSISFYWALDRQFPKLTAHNIFLAEDYKESFDSIFKKHLIPEQPSFYVNVPSRIDPSAAPEGCDSIVVLVPVGHLFDSKSDTHKGAESSPGVSQDWDSMVADARSTILRTIEKRLNISLGPHIVDEVINTPPTWRDAFNLDRGAILGLSHSFFNVLSFRPKTKHPTIKDMYFVGASTHPGTGVPIVLAGAKLVTEQVLGDLGLDERIKIQDRTVRLARAAREPVSKSPLDVERMNTVQQWGKWAVLFLALVLWVMIQLGYAW